MYQGFSSFWKGTSALACAAAAAHRGLVRDHEAVGSNPATRTMQSVLIGSEYPVMDTLLFYVENGETPEMSLLTRSRRHDNVQ